MVKPTPPTAPEAPLRSDPAFSAKAQAFLTWLSGGFYSYVGDAVDFVDKRADEALAAATTFGFPSIAGKALNQTRVNAAGTALEFRTPAQARSDIGLKADVLASGALTGTVMQLFLPANVRSLMFQFWDFAPSVNDANLLLQIGNGTVGSPNWLASNYLTNTIFSSAGGAPAYATSTTTAFPISGPQRSASGDGGGNYHILNFGVPGSCRMFGHRVSANLAGQYTLSSDFYRTDYGITSTSIRWFPSAGAMAGQYMITGFSA
jgi:hypothetical protein